MMIPFYDLSRALVPIRPEINAAIQRDFLQTSLIYPESSLGYCDHFAGEKYKIVAEAGAT